MTASVCQSNSDLFSEFLIQKSLAERLNAETNDFKWGYEFQPEYYADTYFNFKYTADGKIVSVENGKIISERYRDAGTLKFKINNKKIKVKADSIIPGSIMVSNYSVQRPEMCLYYSSDWAKYLTIKDATGNIVGQGYNRWLYEWDYVVLVNIDGSVLKIPCSLVDYNNIDVKTAPLPQMVKAELDHLNCNTAECYGEQFGVKYIGYSLSNFAKPKLHHILDALVELKIQPHLKQYSGAWAYKYTFFDLISESNMLKDEYARSAAFLLFDVGILDTFSELQTNYAIGLWYDFMMANYSTGSQGSAATRDLVSPNRAKKLYISNLDWKDEVVRKLREIEFPIPANETYESFVIGL